MTKTQREILRKLASVCDELYSESLKDENFNSELGEMEIFKQSIDECINTIYIQMEK